jgi:pimeloyl-ACP methyl ester carboxylesterase
MLYADNRGIRIHYRVEGEGPPLILQHGFTQSIDDWYDFGYVDALKRDYRLILLDARGHGQSDKPHDPSAYRLNKRVADVTSVADAGVAKAHFWGYSMGGWIGFGMAKYAPGRVDCLVIGGAHPYARDESQVREFLRAHLGDSSAMKLRFQGWPRKLRAILRISLTGARCAVSSRPLFRHAAGGGMRFRNRSAIGEPLREAICACWANHAQLRADDCSAS